MFVPTFHLWVDFEDRGKVLSTKVYFTTFDFGYKKTHIVIALWNEIYLSRRYEIDLSLESYFKNGCGNATLNKIFLASSRFRSIIKVDL